MSRSTLQRICIHVVAALTALVGVYALLGFIVLPYWIERELPSQGERFGAQLKIQDIRIDPFALELRAQGLEFFAPNGERIGNVPEVALDLAWSSLVRRAWVLQHVTLHQPHWVLKFDAEGRSNLAQMLETKPAAGSRRDNAQAQAAREEMPALVIEALTVRQAQLRYIDARANRVEPFTAAPIDFSVRGLSTAPGEQGAFRLHAALLDDATVEVVGNVGLQPLAATGLAVVRTLAIAPLAAFAMRGDEVATPRGRVDGKLRFQFAQRNRGPSFSITDLVAIVRDFEWRIATDDRPMIAWSQAEIVDAALNLDARSAHVARIALRGAELRAVTDTGGVLNFARIGAAFPESSSNEDSGEPWQIRLDAVDVAQTQMHYADERPDTAITADIARAKAQFSASLRMGGDAPKVELGGLGIELQEILLRAQGPQPLTLALDTARLHAGRVATGAPQVFAETVAFEGGRVALGSPETEPPDVAFGAIRIDEARVDTTGRAVHAAALQFSGLTANVDRGRNGSVGSPSPDRAAHESDRATTTEGASPAVAPWHVRIDRIAGEANDLRYVDRSATPPLSAALRRARIDMGLEVTTGEAVHVIVDALDASATGLAVAPLTGDRPPATLATLTVSKGRLDSAAQRIAAQQVGLSGADVRIERTQAGSLRVAGVTLSSSRSSRDEATPSTQPATPWQYDIGAIRMNDAELTVVDQAYDSPLTAEISLSGTLAHVRRDAAEPMRLDMRARIDAGGTLHARGQIRQDLSAASAQVQFEALSLVPLNPILSQYALLEIASGHAAGNLEVQFSSAADRPLLHLTGQAAIADVVVNEPGRDQPFVAWQRIDAKGMTITLAPAAIHIDGVEIVAPQAALVVSEKRTLNLARVLRNKDAPTQTPGGNVESMKANASPMPITVGRVRLVEGRLQFADLSLVLPFSTRIHDLEGVIVGLSSAPEAHAELRLDGRIADYGSASANGSLNVFDPTRFMAIKVDFDNVLIPPFSPYTATFAGRTIESGRVWLDLDYRITQGALSGENKIVVQNLELGRKVQTAQGNDWPLDLALALLQDANKRISMQIPVSGDVGDPKFDYGQVIRNAIGTALKRIVSAPFRALASLFGGKNVDAARSVVFDPGSERLVPTEEGQLAALAKVLQERPGLGVVVHGPFDPDSDRRALRESALRERVSEALGRRTGASGIPDPIVFSDPSTQAALDVLLERRLSAEDYAAFKRIIGPSDPQYYPAAFGEIAARIEIADVQLRALAERRARAVESALERHGIATDRVVVGEARRVQDGTDAPRLAAELTLDAYRAGSGKVAEGT